MSTFSPLHVARELGLHPRAGLTWQEQALCADVDPELFFPEKGGSPDDAKRVCALCPVRPECLAEGVRIGAYGVWGGTTSQQRRRMGGTQHASAVPYLPMPRDTPNVIPRPVTFGGQFSGVRADTSPDCDHYPGGPRVLAREIGLTVPGAQQLSYEQVEDLAVRAYWRNRPAHGPLCGTERGYGRHLAAGTKTCERCRRAHATVQKANRYRREAAA